VLNVYHATSKARGWKEKPPSKATFVAAAVEEPNLLRRPILIAGKTVVVGKNLTAVKSALG
jgi:arsenate reductase-like glutaredoxin family protein